MAAITILLAASFLGLLGSLFRGLILFWPTMIAIGALHSYVPAVPALGWQACFWIVAIIGLLIPSVSSSASSSS